MKQNSKYKQSTIKNVKLIDSETLYKRFIDKNSPLMKIHDRIDFSFVNELCDDLYSEDGQHSYLPELVFRVSFIQFFKNGLSDNEVVKQCATNMEYRYFCNLAVDDELFDDCKLSRFRSQLGAERFKQIFDLLVQRIKEACLISEDDAQYMDSFLFLADVKLISVNALLSKALQQVQSRIGITDNEIKEDTKKRDFELSEEEQKKRFVFLVRKAQYILALARTQNDLSEDSKNAVALLGRIVRERAEIIGGEEVRKKKSDEEKDKIIAVSDTDARMMGKKEHDVAPSYKSHVAMSRTGFVTATDVTLATVYDGHHAYTLIGDLKSRGFSVPVGVGDTHYGDIALRVDMGLQGTLMVAPYRESQVLNSCLTDDVMIKAWDYNHTKEYFEHRRFRAHIEPKQGEMKNLHGMGRAKFRGLEKVRVQNFMAAIVTNCKKIVANRKKLAAS